jgi:hypothetical protein
VDGRGGGLSRRGRGGSGRHEAHRSQQEARDSASDDVLNAVMMFSVQ